MALDRRGAAAERPRAGGDRVSRGAIGGGAGGRAPDRETIRRVVVETLAQIESRAGGARAGGATAPASRTVALGADHGGFALKETLAAYLRDELGWAVIDHGTHSTEAVDYPDFALAVARSVARGEAARGLLVDGAGIGSTMAANKFRGARAALCHDARTAQNAREHNDANILVLGAGSVGRGLARQIARIFLETAFAGGRHERRVKKIMAIEEARDEKEAAGSK